MPIVTRQLPTGRQLFRTVCVAVAAGWVVGGGGLTLAWWQTGYEAEFGETFGRIGLMMAAFSVVIVLTHYPWTPKYAASMGCRPG